MGYLMSKCRQEEINLPVEKKFGKVFIQLTFNFPCCMTLPGDDRIEFADSVSLSDVSFSNSNNSR